LRSQRCKPLLLHIDYLIKNGHSDWTTNSKLFDKNIIDEIMRQMPHANPRCPDEMKKKTKHIVLCT
jgi:hypothetical protein